MSDAGQGGGAILLWDCLETAPTGAWRTFLWRRFAETPDEVSLPSLVEANAEALRSRLLEWIHDLGEERIRGRRLVDHFQLRPGFSSWWMSLLVEKGYGKSERLYDAVRLLALEDAARGIAAHRLILCTCDQVLASVVNRWCSAAGMSYERRRPGGAERAPESRRSRSPLSHALKALGSLAKHVIQRWPLRKAPSFPVHDSNGRGGVTFVDYFGYLDKSALSSGRLRSHWWGDLGSQLGDAGVPVRWIHHYVPDATVPTPSDAVRALGEIAAAGEGQLHTTLDASLRWKVVLGTLHDYFTSARAAIATAGIKRRFTPAGSNLDLWPLFEDDWWASTVGSTASLNCLYLNLFEEALRGIPTQRFGVYLLENQGWEKALVHAWKSAGHGTLIGVPHATVRFWDLRYFSDPRSYARTGHNDLPLPDRVALNGPAAVDAYTRGGYPTEFLTDVEALRFLYLGQMEKRQAPSGVPGDHGATVLVLGDYMPAITRQQMQWLDAAAASISGQRRYVVRPHPRLPVDPADYPRVHLEVTTAPLAGLLAECDVAYVSNITSAAVDAACAGKPVVQVLDPATFNLSPLRNAGGVVFVKDPNELALALSKPPAAREGMTREFFYLDSALPRWRSLLEVPPPRAA